MGFILLIFHSFFNFDPIKLTGAYAVIEFILFLADQTQIQFVLIKIIAFFILATLITKYSDSIIKWFIILVSAGFLLG